MDSFRLMGEDLWLVDGVALRRATDEWDRRLESAVPPGLRDRFAAEHRALFAEAHRFVTRYNRSLNQRLRGYLALGRACRFEYPWPVVAILGISEVRSGLARSHFYGLLGAAARRVGQDQLDRFADAVADVLRRTNRSIFADSVPTVLFALRCHTLREAGDPQLAEALLEGPLPPAMDAESRRLARGVYDGLSIADGEARFRALAGLTLSHFAREQAIFSYHMGSPSDRRSDRKPSRLIALLSPRQRHVLAPTIQAGKLVFARYPLPGGFDMRDHDARVREFGRAFVRSLTGSRTDCAIATRFVQDERPLIPTWPDGGPPPIDWPSSA